ncbi:MAG: phytoene desaturase family protein [Parvibaculaceae bacterium]
MTNSYDAVIVGAGHNGLVCGTYLAKAGLSVCVLERRPLIGGAAVTEDLWGGFKVSTAAHMMGLMQPKVIMDLELQKFGFEILKPPPLVHQLADERHLVGWSEMDKLCAEFAKFSKKDAEAYPRYCEHLRRVGPIMQRLMWEIPPDPGSRKLSDLKDLLAFAWRFRDIGGRFYDLYDLMTMSAYDYLSRWFESDAVKVVLGYYPAGAAGQSVSIRTPGTAYFLLRAYLRDNDTPAGGTGLVRGGMGSISGAIALSGQRFGLKVRPDAEVSSIVVRDGRAEGVALKSGEEIRAKVVISNADAKTTMLKLVEPSSLPQQFADHIRGIRATTTSFKIHLAVDQLPTYRNVDTSRLGFDYPGQVRIAPSIDYMERAYDEMRQGHISRRPYLTVLSPTVVDPDLAPQGKHILSIYGGHVPSEPRAGREEATEESLFEIVKETLSEHAPGFSNAILHKQVLLPGDFERIFGLPGGHPHHGDISLDQLFFRRPAPHFANYKTPITDLYLCGASTHPGGGVTGVPGHNAARVVLRRFRGARDTTRTGA